MAMVFKLARFLQYNMLGWDYRVSYEIMNQNFSKGMTNSNSNNKQIKVISKEGNTNQSE